MKFKGNYLFIVQSHGIGDALTMTSIVEEYKKWGRVKILSMNSPCYDNLGIVNKNLSKNFINREIISFLGNSHYSNIIGYSNGNALLRGWRLYSKRANKKEHLRTLLLYGRNDVKKKVSDVSKNVKIVFSDEEIRTYSNKFKKILAKEYAIVVSGNGKIKSKTWNGDKFQEVVTKTKRNIGWVQLGGEGDYLLDKNVLNLYGRTSLRETFFLVSKAKFILCSEGMFTHLSSAFNIPCITIYSGYHYPGISSYDNVIPIVPHPLPKCAYCFKSKCIYDNPVCLNNISVEDVTNNVKRLLKH